MSYSAVVVLVRDIACVHGQMATKFLYSLLSRGEDRAKSTSRMELLGFRTFPVSQQSLKVPLFLTKRVLHGRCVYKMEEQAKGQHICHSAC